MQGGKVNTQSIKINKQELLLFPSDELNQRSPNLQTNQSHKARQISQNKEATGNIK